LIEVSAAYRAVWIWQANTLSKSGRTEEKLVFNLTQSGETADTLGPALRMAKELVYRSPGHL